jgi:circadian clock protein KaiC
MTTPRKSNGKGTADASPLNRDKVSIRQLGSGVGGLDEILGGGFPEFSFNIIAGSPGCGKTTLAHQIAFANATVKKPALYFTVLGEPAIKMLRYQQQYSFFDISKVNKAIHFINLSEAALSKKFSEILADISTQVEALNPSIVIVDSFRSISRKTLDSNGHEMDTQAFVQHLSVLLTSWQATTFLIGEYTDDEMQGNPIFTVCDGLVVLTQNVERNSMVRKLQVMKLRGQASVPGLHTFRIGDFGLQAFSRTLGLVPSKAKPIYRRRLSLGIAELDAMTGGGIIEGDSVLIAGPSGTGKSALATQFIYAGLRAKEAAIIVIFEERPEGYVWRAQCLGMDFTADIAKGRLEVLYLRPLDLSVDETMHAILEAIRRTGARRLVIDSITGFEMALAPGFRIDFRESLYRMIAALTRVGVTILSTVEIEDSFTSFAFSQYAISFLTDDIVRMRYVEIEGKLRRVLAIVKTRGGNHSKEIREYVISDSGLKVMDARLDEHRALTTGIPESGAPAPTKYMN